MGTYAVEQYGTAYNKDCRSMLLMSSYPTVWVHNEVTIRFEVTAKSTWPEEARAS